MVELFEFFFAASITEFVIGAVLGVTIVILLCVMVGVL